MKRSPLLWGGAILFLIFALPVLLVIVAIAGIDLSKHPWAISDHIPNSVEILETFSDTSGMDAFYMVKAKYSSEDEIIEICNEFQLLADQDDVPPLGFARLYDERTDIPWFPLENTTRRYAFRSVDDDGHWKENATGRYENILWIDDDNKELIIQVAPF